MNGACLPAGTARAPMSGGGRDVGLGGRLRGQAEAGVVRRPVFKIPVLVSGGNGGRSGAEEWRIMSVRGRGRFVSVRRGKTISQQRRP